MDQSNDLLYEMIDIRLTMWYGAYMTSMSSHRCSICDNSIRTSKLLLLLHYSSVNNTRGQASSEVISMVQSSMTIQKNLVIHGEYKPS